MRKLFLLLLFVGITGATYAQGISYSIITAPCHNDGVIKAYFTGVTPPLTVIWTTEGTSGLPITHTGVTSLNDVLTSYAGGPLTIIATDSTGASDTGHYGGYRPINYALSEVPATCPALDTVSVAITPGTFGTYPYTIQWYNTATLSVVATGYSANLSPGTYGVLVTDAVGCTYGSNVDPYNINVFSLPSFYAGITSTTASCKNGTAEVTAVGGGIAPFSYQWSTGATTDTIINLITGTYQVTMTDALGCSNQASVFIPQSVAISVPVIPAAASCLDTNGSAIAYGSGGAAPYTYSWSNGATTQNITGLIAGTYKVKVTDANGCIGTGSVTVGSSSTLAVSYSASPSLCTTANGNATVVPSGGTGSYNVVWYTTPAQIGVTATHLAAGNYYFTVTDATGCKKDGTVTVPPVDVVSLTFSHVAALCSSSNGSLYVVPTGGAAPYSYLWSTGATTATVTGIPAGNYNLTVTDNLGCKTTASPTLGSFSPVSVGVMSTPASCIFANDGTNTVTAYGGTPPYTYAWSSGGNTAVINALPVGPYWVTATDATGCTAYLQDYSYVRTDTPNNDCYCTISGTVFADTNGNCVQDAGEVGIPNIQIYISGRGYTYTDASGNYTYQVPAGTYTVSETVLPYYPLSACQGNAITIVTSAGASCLHTVNFANGLDSLHDMHISTWDYTLPTPGNAYTQTTIITNDGTIPESNILAVYNPDGQFFEPSFMPSTFSATSNPYSYSTAGFPTLNPGATQQNFMTYHVPTNIASGTNVVFHDTVAYDSPIDFWLFDNTTSNNVNSLTTAVTATASPNFKEVSPKGTGANGLISYTDSVLEYMIHFENTGSYMAENITVIDTLDDNLDWTTLRPEYYSAPCKITLQQSGAKKIATFTFNDIDLPTQANNPLGNHGMLTYTIHIKPGLASGTQFGNRASVYFDYHAPVMTNTTINTLGTVSSGVKNVAAQNNYAAFTIYPNPANESFNAVINSDVNGSAIMNVTDITGKTLIAKTIALQKGTQTITTDAGQLAPGMYLVTFNFAGKLQTQKLVIMK